MAEIYGVDGRVLTEKKFEFNGFTFDSVALQNNPFLLLMATIVIDPTPLQKEFLEKLELTFMDADGKQIFPQVEEGKDN